MVSPLDGVLISIVVLLAVLFYTAELKVRLPILIADLQMMEAL